MRKTEPDGFKLLVGWSTGCPGRFFPRLASKRFKAGESALPFPKNQRPSSLWTVEVAGKGGHALPKLVGRILHPEVRAHTVDNPVTCKIIRQHARPAIPV